MLIALFLINSLLFSQILPDTNISYLKKFGEFKGATSITIARGEYVFVADPEVNLIYKYDINGNLLSNFGGSGFSNNEFDRPVFVDATNGLNLYVADYNNNRVQRYDLNYNYLNTINFNNYNLKSITSTKIYNPFGLSFSTNNEIFVLARAGNYKILRTDDIGNIDLFFGQDVGEDKVVQPIKIITGNKQNLYIYDKTQRAVLNFDNNGTFVNKIENKEKADIINITYNDDNLYIMYDGLIYIYDTEKKQYINSITYKIPEKISPVDIVVKDENSIFILTKSNVYNINFK